jgi:hypothetical protein
MAKVEAPNKDYSGPGPGGAEFKDGVAEVNDEAALNYYRGAGYSVSGKVENPVESPEPPDPREVTESIVGTRLRDAAVDPEPSDFLAPVNAGDGNPHGSAVVSPEIHASGPSGIRPGSVFAEDVAKQEKREADFAAARLIDNVTAAEAIEGEIEDLDDRGELGISDPGSADQGRAGAEDNQAPTKASNKAAWVDHAVAQGAERDEAEAMTKAELVERYS